MEIVPLLCFLLMIFFFTGPWRERFLLASISWSVLVLIITETLSLWHGLDRLELAVAWTVVLIILGSKLLLSKSIVGAQNVVPFRFDWKCAAIILMVSGILLVTAIVAYFAAPNNWDSMTYHLARMAHWAQDRTIAMFPTSNTRQIIFPTWNAYAVLQFYMLSNSDRWVNFIQWFSSLGSMLGASLIVARLKGDTQAQALAALIVATIPMGILQSTSTQNDYVVSFWLVSFAYFGLSLLQEGGWLYCMAAGTSLGLAWLVKGTAYVYGTPFLIWFIVGGIRAQGRKFLKYSLVIILMAVLLNSSYFCRNISLTGTIIPAVESTQVINKNLDFKVMVDNFVLNLGLHAATVWEAPNRLVEKLVKRVLDWSGIQQGDPRLYLGDGTSFVIMDRSFRYHEDYAGNFIHTVLILFCFIAVLFFGLKISKESWYYAWVMLGAILFFVVMVKWSLYHSRYHLPVFVLFAPFLAIVLSSCFRSWGVIVIAVILALASISWLVGNKTRPLLGPRSVITAPRMDQYFFNRPQDASYVYPLMAAAQVNCKQVGLIIDGDTWEYALRVISKWQNRGDIRFEHIAVDNVSAKLPYPLGPFDPCLIIKKGNDNPEILNWQGSFFKEIDNRGVISTYLRVN